MQSVDTLADRRPDDENEVLALLDLTRLRPDGAGLAEVVRPCCCLGSSAVLQVVGARCEESDHVGREGGKENFLRQTPAIAELTRPRFSRSVLYRRDSQIPLRTLE